MYCPFESIDVPAQYKIANFQANSFGVHVAVETSACQSDQPVSVYSVSSDQPVPVALLIVINLYSILSVVLYHDDLDQIRVASFLYTFKSFPLRQY